MADSQPHAFLPPETPQTIRAKKRFSAADAPTETSEFDDAKDILKKNVDRIYELQRKLYADNHHSLLLVFQAMDAAGKDSTIRHVLSGVNPAGFQVFSFKQPSSEELEHDFLWRSAQRLPERGRIGVFNRSYYEETLVVRVHPEYLGGQHLPAVNSEHVDKSFWEHRFESIRNHEAHLARNGTVILKFWLNVSLDEQKARFIDRLRQPEKNWKFSESDLAERTHWDDYMHAYSEMLPETSRPWAPWFAIPADSKKRMRAMVSQIVADTLEAMPLKWPAISEEMSAEYADILNRLERD